MSSRCDVLEGDGILWMVGKWGLLLPQSGRMGDPAMGDSGAFSKYVRCSAPRHVSLWYNYASARLWMMRQ